MTSRPGPARTGLRGFAAAVLVGLSAAALVAIPAGTAQAGEVYNTRSALTVSRYIPASAPSSVKSLARGFTPAGSYFTASHNSGRSLSVAVARRSDRGISAAFDLMRPKGETIKVGTYRNIGNGYANPDGGGLTVSLENLVCGRRPTATLKVTSVQLGRRGYVQEFHATYSQRCEYGITMKGRIDVHQGPPPPNLTIDVAPRYVTPAAGNEPATITVVYTCSRRAYLAVTSGSAYDGDAGGSFDERYVTCSTKPRTYTHLLGQSADSPQLRPGQRLQVSGQLLVEEAAYFPMLAAYGRTFAEDVRVVG